MTDWTERLWLVPRSSLGRARGVWASGFPHRGVRRRRRWWNRPELTQLSWTKEAVETPMCQWHAAVEPGQRVEDDGQSCDLEEPCATPSPSGATHPDDPDPSHAIRRVGLCCPGATVPVSPVVRFARKLMPAPRDLFAFHRSSSCHRSKRLAVAATCAQDLPFPCSRSQVAMIHTADPQPAVAPPGRRHRMSSLPDVGLRTPWSRGLEDPIK